jgi:hypothetical protein
VGDNGSVTTQPQMPSPEPLEHPERKGMPGWLAPVLALVVFLVIVGVGGLVVTDWALRNAEMNSLVSSVEVSEDAMGALQGTLGATFDSFGGQGQLSPTQRASLNSQIQQVAQEGHDSIQKAGAGVESVSILPWHTSILRAKDAYVRHNHAWQDYLAKAAQDPAEVTRPQNEINDSFAAAEKPMKSAVPMPWLYELKNRVDFIFAPPAEPATSDGPTQSVAFTVLLRR